MKFVHLVNVVVCFALMSGAASADLFNINDARGRFVRSEYFGTHFHRLVADPYKPLLPRSYWPDGYIGSIRLWDSRTRWADLEKKKGVFDFSRMDAYVDIATAGGASITYVFGSPPRWASSRPNEASPYGPGGQAEPRSMEDWDSYVAAVVRRYKGRIKRYELWNEPYFSDIPGDRNRPLAFFSGSVDVMVELARRADAILAKEDPEAELLGPGFVGAPSRLDMFLKSGGGKYIDGVAYHYYVSTDAEFVKLHRDVMGVLKKNSLSHLKIYNTESGFSSGVTSTGRPLQGGEPVSDELAGSLLMRTMIVGAFLGVEQYFQYSWESNVLRSDGLDYLPAAEALLKARRWLLDAEILGCSEQGARVVKCEARRNGRSILIFWRTTSGVELVPIPSGFDGSKIDALPWSKSGRLQKSAIFVDENPVAIISDR